MDIHQRGTVHKAKTSKYVVVAVIIGFSFVIFVIFFTHQPITDISQPTGQISSLVSENLQRIKVSDDVVRSEAIELVSASADKDLWNRLKINLTFVDVYNNPKGDGVIVWLSSYRGGGGYIYLVQDKSVFGITPDAKFISPTITLTKDVNLDDLKDIEHWRSKDDKMKYLACMKHANILESQGLVGKRIIEQRNECKTYIY